MHFLHTLFKLGTEVFGTNEDLTPIDINDGKPDGSDGDADGSDAEGDGSDADESDGKPDGSESDGDADGDGSESNGSDGSESDGDGDADGKSDGSEGDGSDGDGSDADGDGDADGDAGPGGRSGQTAQTAPNEGTLPDDTALDLDRDGPTGAGGNVALGDKQDGETHDWAAMADALREGMEAGNPGTVDSGKALQAAVEGERDDHCEDGEAVWRPYDPEADRVVKPRGNTAQAEALRKRARTLTAALRASFRRKFLQYRDPKVTHGVKRGKDLSERRLVESFVEIKSGINPTRPDYRIEAQRDVSLAVAVVGDESGSMYGQELIAASTAMIAIAEAFDSLGSPVMCCGPRDGGSGINWSGHHDRAGDRYDRDRLGVTQADTAQYHREWPIVMDLFKDWDEPFRSCKRRFAAYSATGSTPLSDGIQYALDSISDRPERHRIVLVLTDGEPNNPWVVRRQIRLAKEAGVTVIGVGISDGCHRVPGLFPDHHVKVSDLSELPKRMIAAVEEIVFPKTGGKRVALDGQIKRKVSKGRRTAN